MQRIFAGGRRYVDLIVFMILLLFFSGFWLIQSNSPTQKLSEVTKRYESAAGRITSSLGEVTNKSVHTVSKLTYAIKTTVTGYRQVGVPQLYLFCGLSMLAGLFFRRFLEHGSCLAHRPGHLCIQQRGRRTLKLYHHNKIRRWR